MTKELFVGIFYLLCGLIFLNKINVVITGNPAPSRAVKIAARFIILILWFPIAAYWLIRDYVINTLFGD